MTEQMKSLEEKIIELASKKHLKIAAAESCTGGLVSAALINVSGASDCFEEGFITYSNDAKMRSLHVSEDILKTYGAVSEECAAAMAKGAAEAAGADLAVSTTGIAGPTGGTEEKPVGLVYIGICFHGHVFTLRNLFSGSRMDVRNAAAKRALELLSHKLEHDTAN